MFLGGILYISWPLAWLWYPDFFKVHSFYLSELAALSQPTSAFFRTVDFLSGFFVVLSVALILYSFPRTSHEGTSLVKVLWVGVGIVGVTTIFDSFFPMSCAPTVEPTCNQTFLDFSRPFSDSAHEITSSFAQAGIIVALVSATVLLFKPRYIFTDSVRYVFANLPVFVKVFTILALGTSLFLAVAPFVSFLPINIFQPLGVTSWGLWAALCSRFFSLPLNSKNAPIQTT